MDRKLVAGAGVSGSSPVGLILPINPGFAAGSSRPEQSSLLVLVCCSGFECGQSGAVLLTYAMVTTVTTLWEGVLDLWSGHARLLPCLWWEPKGELRYLGDGGDSGDENHNLLGDVTAADRSPTTRVFPDRVSGLMGRGAL
jgi:hypothetical protein